MKQMRYYEWHEFLRLPHVQRMSLNEQKAAYDQMISESFTLWMMMNMQNNMMASSGGRGDDGLPVLLLESSGKVLKEDSGFILL